MVSPGWEGLRFTNAQGSAPGFTSLYSSCSGVVAAPLAGPPAELWVGLAAVPGAVAVGLQSGLPEAVAELQPALAAVRLKSVFCFSCCFPSRLISCLVIASYGSHRVENNIWYCACIGRAFIWFQQEAVWLTSVVPTSCSLILIPKLKVRLFLLNSAFFSRWAIPCVRSGTW